MSQHASSGYHCELKDGGVACPTGKNDSSPAARLSPASASSSGVLIPDHEPGVSEPIGHLALEFLRVSYCEAANSLDALA
jgi:hypothetical protein